MQRLFSTFPSGLVGAGLLLLRALLSFQLVVEGTARFAGMSVGIDLVTVTIGTVWIICACAILPGLMTPVAAIVIAIGATYALVAGVATDGVPSITPGGWWWPPLFEVVLAISLALLGPGAYSIDARLFGRREIILKPHSFQHLTQ